MEWSEIDDGRSKSYHQVDSINGHSLVFTSALSQDVPSGTAVRVVEFSLSLTDGSTSERFDHLSLNPSANNYVVNIVNLQSRLVQVSDEGSSATPFPSTCLAQPTAPHRSWSAATTAASPTPTFIAVSTTGPAIAQALRPWLTSMPSASSPLRASPTPQCRLS